jgi:hypothetical protein
MRVAGTVSVVLAQTEQVQPTVTSTFPATPPSFSTTPAPTETPTPTTNPSQNTLAQQAGGSTLFEDERAGYEGTIPAETNQDGVEVPIYQKQVFLQYEIWNAIHHPYNRN